MMNEVPDTPDIAVIYGLSATWAVHRLSFSDEEVNDASLVHESRTGTASEAPLQITSIAT